MVDEPESKDITCIKGGNTKHPCELCMIEHQQLHVLPVVLEGKIMFRTQKAQEEACNKIRTARDPSRCWRGR